MEPYKHQTPSKSNQSSSTNPHPDPGPQNRHSASSISFSKPVVRQYSRDPREAKKSGQNRSMGAAEQGKVEQKVINSPHKVIIEIPDDDNPKGKGVVVYSFQSHLGYTGVQLSSNDSEPEPTSRSESPSLFLPQHEPALNTISQAPGSSRLYQTIEKECIDLRTPSPPRQRPSLSTFSNSGARPRSLDGNNGNTKDSSVGSKRTREREIAEDFPSKRSGHRTLQTEGNHQRGESTRHVPGTGMLSTPRELFQAALREHKGQERLVRDIMELYDRFH